MVKPNVPVAAVTEFLDGLFASRPAFVQRLTEGQESQAFRFDVGRDALVLRITPSIRGFEKDRWVYETVGKNVPVPRVVTLGRFDAANAFCVSEWTPGVTLEELDRSDVEAVVDDVRKVWSQIAECEVASADGFGDFDADGAAPALSWREVLQTTLEAGSADLSEVARSTDLPDPGRVLGTYRELIEHCPEQRALIHGDFGSNNILIHEDRVTAVLDWDCAMVGDPLYDIANTRFWATYLSCMQLQAEHFDRTLAHFPGYDDRVLCYSLRIGIEEARGCLAGGDREMAAWAMARCRELIEPQSPLS